MNHRTREPLSSRRWWQPAKFAALGVLACVAAVISLQTLGLYPGQGFLFDGGN